MRIKSISVAIGCIFGLLVLGLFYLSVMQGEAYRQLSKKNCIRLLPQMGSRGRILDRSGTAIAVNSLAYDVMILPQESLELEKTFSVLSKIVSLSPGELRKRFRENYTNSSVPVRVIENIDTQKAIALEELKFDCNGILIQPHPLRYYPYGKLASHLLGYLSEIDRWRLTKLEDYGYKTKDIVGFGGVEEKYDYYLRQEDGGTSVEVDRKGRFVRVVGFAPPRSGKDIQLTIDIKIQKIVEDALLEKKGGVIIMEPFTGEIIALANVPDFDPRVFIAQDNDAIRQIIVNPDSPLFDRAISGTYPPGSVFKAIVASAGLELNKINISSSYLCEGGITVGDQRFDCSGVHGQQNLIDALAHSCNVFFYRLGLLLGPQNMYEWGIKFGLSKATGIDVPYEANGFVPNSLWKRIYRFNHWFDGDTANFSIGQGDLLVTPLQMVRMMAVFANGGKLVTPYAVKAVEGKDISAYQRRIVKVPLGPQTLDLVKRGLRGAVEYPQGTANVLCDLAVAAAGKTGTAQAPPGFSHGWFVGFFPYENPRFVICAFLEHGGPGHYASMVVKEIMEGMEKQGLLTADYKL